MSVSIIYERIIMHNYKYIYLVFIVPLGGISSSFCMERILKDTITIEDKYTQFIEKESKFKQKLPQEEFPVKINSVSGYFDEYYKNAEPKDQLGFKQQIIQFAESAEIVSCSGSLRKAADFLNQKRTSKNPIDQIYRTMTLEQFIWRLFKKRLLTCFDSAQTVLILGEKKRRSECGPDIAAIGTLHEKEPFTLKNFLSESERDISELFGIATETFFINNGRNGAKPDKQHELTGILIGLVGPCYETSGKKSCKNLIHNKDKQEKDIEILGLKSMKFYDPAMVRNDTLAGLYFRPSLHQKRLKYSIQAFLEIANCFAARRKQKAYLHVIGIGTGAWRLFLAPTIETKIMFQEYIRQLIKTQFSNIDTINFSGFMEAFPQKAEELFNSLDTVDKIQEKNPDLAILFSIRNLAQKFDKDDAGKLLIGMYAWDDIAIPGNEYWVGSLSASSDPAAMSCSLGASLQNPYINGKNIKRSIQTKVNEFIAKNEQYAHLMLNPKQIANILILQQNGTSVDNVISGLQMLSGCFNLGKK